MWQYNNTKPNNGYVKHNNTELFHSDTYLGNEFEDELYHWKYIERIKTSKGWKYIYNKAKKAVNNALGADERKAYEKAGKDWMKADKEVSKAYEKYNNSGTPVGSVGAKIIDPEAEKEYKDALAKKEKAEKRLKESSKKYSRTVYGKIEKAKSNGTIKKAKKWLGIN